MSKQIRPIFLTVHAERHKCHNAMENLLKKLLADYFFR